MSKANNFFTNRSKGFLHSVVTDPPNDQITLITKYESMTVCLILIS